MEHNHGASEPAVSDGDGGQINQEPINIPPRTTASPTASTEAMQFRDRVIENVEDHGWLDPVNASKDGYRPMDLDPEHWYNPEFLTDGMQFDPTAPEFLVVQDDQVVGTMFLADSFSFDPPDPPGSPFIRWHYHRYDTPVCFRDGVAISIKGSGITCPTDTVESSTSPAMAHVWLVDIEDPFTEEMDAYRQAS